MKKINFSIIWWLVVISYISIIYATLGIAPKIWDLINDLLGGRGVMAQHFIYTITSSLIFLYLVYIKKENALIKYFWFFICIGLGFLIVKTTPFPAEKIHIAEYGILGVLLYNALKIHSDRFCWKLYVAGVLLCMAIGAVDEVIQFLLPNRVFDWRDIFLNGASGALTLFLIRFSILKERV